MSNKFRYVDIELDKPRKLRYDLNALCELEDRFDKPIMEILHSVEGSMNIKLVRTLIWAGLIHEDKELTEEQVGAMIGLDNIIYAQGKLTEALNTSFAGKNVKRPGTTKKRPSGTGKK